MSETAQPSAIQDLNFSCTLRYSDASEVHLLSASQSGDSLAFAELYRRHSQFLKRTILRIVRHREDAEDVLQETLLRAYKNLSRFRGTCKFSTWLTRIGINSSLMHLRKRSARSWQLTGLDDRDDSSFSLESSVADAEPNPEQRYIREQSRQFLAQSVGRLPGDFRNLVDRHHAQGFQVAEIAADLGITLTAAKARLHRARRLLRKRLQAIHVV